MVDYMNQICPFCKKEYMDAMWFTLDAYSMQGEFKCKRCRHETFITAIDDDAQYAYPFEELRGE
jgi:hypothetical protein